MEISPIQPQQPGASGSGFAGIADDFNTFLTLLTTQLRNQDPLEPTDTNEFTNQLVAFAGVEQQIRTNDQLELIAGINAFSQNTAAVSFLGREVTVAGDSGENRGEGIGFQYVLPVTAERTELEILDSDGKVVFREDGQTAFGLHNFEWPGTDSSGAPVPPGSYRLRVVAKDAEDNAITADLFVRGRVSEVETGTSTPILTVDGRQVALQNVLAVRDPDL